MSRREPTPACASTLWSLGASASAAKTRFGGPTGTVTTAPSAPSVPSTSWSPFTSPLVATCVTASSVTSNSPDSTCANTSPACCGATAGAASTREPSSSPFSSSASDAPSAKRSLRPRSRRPRRRLRSERGPSASAPSGRPAELEPSAVLAAWTAATDALGSANAGICSAACGAYTGATAAGSPLTSGAEVNAAALRLRTGLTGASAVNVASAF